MDKHKYKDTKLIRVGKKYHKLLKQISANELVTMTHLVEDLIKSEYSNYDLQNTNQT